MSGFCGVSKRKYFCLADIIVVAVVIVAVVVSVLSAVSFGDDSPLVAVITVDGKVYDEINLSDVDKDYELTLGSEQDAVLRISCDGVGFVSSGCPDKLCVNTGFITRAGQSAVCLPARVAVKLVSQGGTDVPDAVVG